MSPTHSNKRGVRYRYYVSHSLLQKRRAVAGSVGRVPAPDIEALVLEGVRKHLASAEAEPAMNDRELIERHVERVIIKPQAVEVQLLAPVAGAASTQAISGNAPDQSAQPGTTITLPWSAPSLAAVKGIIHAPSARPGMKPELRQALLTTIAKARSWIDEVQLGGVASFAEITERESKHERRVRLLAPLAFVSPGVVTAIIDATAPADLTVTGLAKSLPYSWAKQERHVGLVR
jgi:site-specific DNA recombinase